MAVRVKGERWEFQLGNNRLVVENAWVWYGYSQERVRLNGEVIYERKGWGYIIFTSTLLTEFELLDEVYGIIVGILTKGLDYSIYCRVITDDKVYEPDDWSEAHWDTETYQWPPDPDPYALP